VGALAQRFAFGIVLLSLSWSGCEPSTDVDLVAKIGAEEITLDQLRQFREESTAQYREPEEGLQAWRFYLQTMIDMKLLLVEAMEQRLDLRPEFARKWEGERRKKIIDEFATREIVRGLDLDIDEIRQRFEHSKWNRVLRLARIRTESAAEAQKAIRDLEQGRAFEEVARERSVVSEAEAQSGALAQWYGRTNLEELGVDLEIGKELFEMQVGEFSQPYQVGDNFEIFKLLDEGPAPQDYEAAFTRAEYLAEFRARWDSLVDQLRDRWEARVDQEAIRFLVEKMTASDNKGMLLAPEEQQIVLCDFEGGQITLKDFAETYNALWFFRSVSFDSSGITEFVEQDLLPRALVYQAAKQQGLDREPEVAAWLKEKRESLLLEALREKEVVQRVVTDSNMVRDYYTSHLNQFMEMEEIQVAEILVATRAEAEKLLQRVRDGEKIQTLAARHSIREGVEHGHFHMHNHVSERRVFGGLYDAVIEVPVGALNGPVELEEGYSIFKVLERTPPHPSPFEQVASRAKWWVQKQQESKLFDALFANLRDKYSSRVVVFEEQLSRLVAN
jgi:parvulin-like peptidyl-prolyl isomerase